MFACEHETVRTDLMCVAKGITGGYLPLAATFATQRIFDAFLGEPWEGRTFFHGHTYTGNPLACRGRDRVAGSVREEPVLVASVRTSADVVDALRACASSRTSATSARRASWWASSW